MDVDSSIKELRLARGLTQEELAATLYVSRQTISRWESGRTTPDAQSLVMMGALFEVPVDTLVKGGVEAMMEVQARQSRRTRTSLALGAAIGLAGCAVVAPALVQAAGPAAGGALSLTPLVTALAVAGAARARGREAASVSVLREALRSGLVLHLTTQGGPRDMSASVTDDQGGSPYAIDHTARVFRGERWVIRDREGRRVARVAYRLITAGIQTPSLEARVDGVGTVSLRKDMLLNSGRHGMAAVWRLDGCDVGISDNWLGDRIELTRGDRQLATLSFSPCEKGEVTELRIERGIDADLAVTLTFLLALLRAEERVLKIEPMA